MSTLLTDTYSITRLQKLGRALDKAQSHRHPYLDAYHMIDNLVLCDHIYYDPIGATTAGVEFTCQLFGDIFQALPEGSIYSKDSSEEKQHSKYERFIIHTLHYLHVAETKQLYFSPHPARSNYLVKNLHLPKPTIANKMIAWVDGQFSTSAIGHFSGCQFAIPPIADLVFRTMEKNQINFTEAIYRIRNAKTTQDFRAWCRKIDATLATLSGRAVIELHQHTLQELKTVTEAWIVDLNHHRRYKKRTLFLGKLWGVGELLSFSGIEKLSINDKILKPAKPHLLFLNDLYRQ